MRKTDGRFFPVRIFVSSFVLIFAKVISYRENNGVFEFELKRLVKHDWKGKSVDLVPGARFHFVKREIARSEIFFYSWVVKCPGLERFQYISAFMCTLKIVYFSKRNFGTCHDSQAIKIDT